MLAFIRKFDIKKNAFSCRIDHSVNFVNFGIFLLLFFRTKAYNFIFFVINDWNEYTSKDFEEKKYGMYILMYPSLIFSTNVDGTDGICYWKSF